MELISRDDLKEKLDQGSELGENQIQAADSSAILDAMVASKWQPANWTWSRVLAESGVPDFVSGGEPGI